MTNVDLLENQRDKLITKRYNKEKRFILIGRLAIALTIMFLTILLGSIVLRGISGFTTTTITFNVTLDKKLIDPESTNDKKVISSARWRKITRDSIYNVLNEINLVYDYVVLKFDKSGISSKSEIITMSSGLAFFRPLEIQFL